MKYLYYTLSFVLILSIGSLLTFLLRPSPEAKPDDLIVNQRIVTADEIQTRWSDSPYHFEGEDDFLEDLITRELLIQEAQRQQIDHEEPFRRSLQNYYEQSLLKSLLDRQYERLSVDLTQERLGQVRNNLQSHFVLQINYYADLETAEKNGRPAHFTSVTGNYLELPETIRDAVADLAIGESSPPIQTGPSCFRVTLKEKKIDQQTQLSEYSADAIAETALEEQKRRAMQQWLSGLRNRAKIILPANIR